MQRVFRDVRAFARPAQLRLLQGVEGARRAESSGVERRPPAVRNEGLRRRVRRTVEQGNEVTTRGRARFGRIRRFASRARLLRVEPVSLELLAQAEARKA